MKYVKVLAILSLAMLAACSSVKDLTLSETNLSSTTWRYRGGSENSNYDISFLPGGVLKSTHPNDTSPDNDFWIQNGTEIEFSFNDGYVTYTGSFKSANKITGKATNKVNKTWKWKLTRK